MVVHADPSQLVQRLCGVCGAALDLLDGREALGQLANHTAHRGGGKGAEKDKKQ